MGKPSLPKAWRSYSPHIPKGATLIHDGERSHSILIEKLALKSEVHSTEETKGILDGVNPMNEINTIHRYLKRFLSRHDGFDTDGLQDWLNLFCFPVERRAERLRQGHGFHRQSRQKKSTSEIFRMGRLRIRRKLPTFSGPICKIRLFS